MSDPAFTPWPAEFAARYRAAGYWQGKPLGELLRDSAIRYPERTAVVCGQRRWTYPELDAKADSFAAGLHRLGLGAGDRVLVQLSNRAEFLVACFALFRLGALPVFALPAHRRAEIAYFCKFTEARACITVDRDGGFDYRQMMREVRAEAPQLEYVIVVGAAEEFCSFDTLPCAPVDLAAVDAAGVAFLQLSGGSTGLPKLIPRTHDDYFYSVRASTDICGLTSDSVYLCALPAAHNFPLSSPGTLGVLHAGGCVVMAPHPSPDTAFPLIAAEGVTHTALVPPLALMWMEAATARRHDLSSLTLLQVGGARLSIEAARRVRPALGCRLQQVFGMAEGLVNYTRLDDDEALVIETQGRAISPDDEVRVVDDDDRELAVGESGHLLTRGPYTIRGYYKAEAHNRRAFTADGFYRTGDIVRLLSSGHIVVEGRAKDQINRGGEKLAAEEVENHLLTHTSVLDAAVVAMPDAYLGERACAFIVPRDPTLLQPRQRGIELANYLRSLGLAHYKVPDRFEFVSAFPKTGVGKVDKRALRARFTAPASTL
jgi:2,3-dihydroxybenzoate-AMP ligase